MVIKFGRWERELKWKSGENGVKGRLTRDGIHR